MKKTKTETRFEYVGLGFPVILQNVPMIEVRGLWTPNIDHNLLQKVVLYALANLPSALTGNHIRFILSWLGLTQPTYSCMSCFQSQQPAIKSSTNCMRDLCN